ncbi:MAG: energy transducer TonB [Pyrinomonadaceae bacterium]
MYFLYPAGSLAKYDADKEEFTVNIPTKRFYKGKPGEIAGVTKLTPPEIFHSVVARDPVTTNDGTYIGTNAYGAQVTVFKRSTTERRLIVSNFSESRGGQTLLGEPSLLATFSSPQAKAQELKHNLAVLYIAKPVEPYIESSTFFDKATLNRPQDVHTTSYYLVVRVAEIWIVDSRNGTVLTAILPSDGKFTNPVPPSLLVPGKLISSAKATRSAQARKEMVSGVVTVRVVVGEDGNVISATAISGHPLLRGTSEAAARGSKFSPGVRDGKPASFEIVLTYNFPDY